MILKRKLYTTDPKFKFAASLDRIDKVQSLAKGLTTGITHVEYLDPATIRTRIRSAKDKRLMVDWSSIPVVPGFTSIGLHLTPKDRGRLKLAGTIKGAYRNSTKAPITYYVVASRAKDFEKLVLHEEGHGFEDLGTVDLTGLKKTSLRGGPLHLYAMRGDYKGFYRRVSFV